MDAIQILGRSVYNSHRAIQALLEVDPVVTKDAILEAIKLNRKLLGELEEAVGGDNEPDV